MKKKLFVKVALFILLMYILDVTAGLFSEYLIKNAKSGTTKKVEHICNSTFEDILIFGSSRGTHNYDPRIIKDSLNMSVYNCAFEGCGSILLYGFLEILTDHYIPKYIIYDIHPTYDYLKSNEDNTKYLGNLKSYYDVPGIDSLFWKIDNKERYKMISHLYRINGHLIQMISNNFIKNDQLIFGFQPRNKKMQKEPQIDNSTKKLIYDPIKIYYFDKIVKLCNTKGIKLILYSSPSYKMTNDYELDYIKDISKVYKIPFVNHSCDTRFINQRNLFYDSIHMNGDGATAYTKIVASEIKQIILNQK